jgi:hypothetical protein
MVAFHTIAVISLAALLACATTILLIRCYTKVMNRKKTVNGILDHLVVSYHTIQEDATVEVAR